MSDELRFTLPAPTPPELATSGCDSLKYRAGPSGVITSPGFDEKLPYQEDADCEWVITVTVGTVRRVIQDREGGNW